MLASAPDVALCAGNGFVVEVVNQVRMVWYAVHAPSTDIPKALLSLAERHCVTLLTQACCAQLMAVMMADGKTVTPPTALPTFFGAGAPFDRPGFFTQPSCALP